MYRIDKRFEFSASHQLSHLPDGHKCKRLHGHTYTVEIILQSEQVNSDGFIIDYGELTPLKSFIDTHLDHRHLNEALPCYPTAENIAKFLFDWCKGNTAWPIYAMRVSETPNTWAEYRE